MSYEHKYPTFSDVSSASSPFLLEFHHEPMYRSLGAAAKPEQEFAPLSSLKVSDLSMPSMNWSLSGHTENMASKKADLDFNVSPSFSLGTQPRPIREKPCYFEKHTSFTSSDAPATIFDSVVHALNQLRVDFEFQHAKNKIMGVCYPNNLQCVFRVNIFRAEDSYLVEFQRRQGCVLAFSTFYADVRKVMTGKAASSASPGPSETPAGLDNVSVENLVRMASSPLADVQREGLRTLANCARTPSNRKLLLGSCSFLSEVLSSSSDTEVVRLASELAGHMCSSPAKDALAVAESVFQALASQSSNSSLTGRSAKRSLAQAAAGYSQSHKKHFRQEKYVSCLEKYSCSADERTRVAANSALDVLVC